MVTNPKSKIQNPKSKIGFGVVGCGWVARDYAIPAILASCNARLVAVCDLDCRNFETINSDKVFCTTDYEEFLRRADLQAVYIATPNNSHRRLTEAAAREGKHVLCEKPMAIDYEDARRMVEICRESRVQYATAFDQRFHVRHLKLRELIANRVLGEISTARVHYACWLAADWAADNWRIDRERAGGGAFVDLAPHGIDLLQFLLDEEIVEFRAFLQSKIQNYAVDDGAVAIGRFASGALLQMNVAYNCPDNFPRRSLEIVGTKAMAIAVNTMGQTAGGNLFLIDSATGERTEINISETEDVSPFLRQIETFADCLLQEKPFPFAPARDLRTMEILIDAA